MLRRILPDEFLVIATLVVATSSFALLGCEEEPSWQNPGPAATFETFLMDWYRGEQKAAFAAITPEDRQELTEPLAKLEGRVDEEHLPDEVDMLVVGRVDNPYDIKDIELEEAIESAPKKGQKVDLELIYHDGRKGKATLIWGGERWFVDLPLQAEGGQPNKAEPTPEKTPTEDAAPAAGAPGETEPADAGQDSASGDASAPDSP